MLEIPGQRGSEHMHPPHLPTSTCSEAHTRASLPAIKLFTIYSAIQAYYATSVLKNSARISIQHSRGVANGLLAR